MAVRTAGYCALPTASMTAGVTSPTKSVAGAPWHCAGSQEVGQVGSALVLQVVESAQLAVPSGTFSGEEGARQPADAVRTKANEARSAAPPAVIDGFRKGALRASL